MPFLKLFNFEPTEVTERAFAPLSNLHIKKPPEESGLYTRKKNSKAFQCLDYAKTNIRLFQ